MESHTEIYEKALVEIVRLLYRPLFTTPECEQLLSRYHECLGLAERALARTGKAVDPEAAALKRWEEYDKQHHICVSEDIGHIVYPGIDREYVPLIIAWAYAELQRRGWVVETTRRPEKEYLWRIYRNDPDHHDPAQQFSDTKDYGGALTELEGCLDMILATENK